MNIPDEVIEAVTGMHPEQREYPDDVRKDFHSAAEWARKEALREAEKAVRDVDPGAFNRGLIMMDEDAAYCAGIRDSSHAIHALAKGAPDGQQ